MRQYPRLILKKGREATLGFGHPWLFSGAVARVDGDPAPGAVVTAADAGGRPLALGFYGTGDIAFRLLADDPAVPIDASFWRRRIEAALALRRRVVPAETTACRLINAEGDRMPGLVVDRYADWLVMTIGTAGMEPWRETLISILAELLKPRGIYERSEGRSRRREGLADRVGSVAGETPGVTEIRENGLAFRVDPVAGQKTGFFLDQRLNREILGGLSSGARVLNGFSYTGAFSVYAARGGATQVTSVEVSAAANALAAENLTANGFSLTQHPLVTADCFDYLREGGEPFNLIVLDPPAFAKTRKDVARAVRGYREINRQAALRLREGGILATFSCSNPIDELLFHRIVLGGIRDAGRTAQVLACLGPGPDHPVLLSHPEGRYLKGLLLCLTSG